ncbi:MAG TPA: LysE family transporter [Kofleriaceae bacterium]|nr:LysE family transporter [Kofleriaceae bacterium]
MLSLWLLGATIGAVSGIPIGPVNVAVIDAAYRRSLMRAVAVGLGGALADMSYAFLGLLGLGPILNRHPSVPPILYALSGVVLIIYGALTARAQEIDPPPPSKVTSPAHFFGGVGLGVALIVLNPAALVTWVVIVGSAMPDLNLIEGTTAALGIGTGSFLWFAFVAHLADRGKKVLGKRLVLITRIVGILLIGYGVFSLLRAANIVFDIL